MKRTFILLIATLASIASFAAPSIKAKKVTGNWSLASDWDLTRLPANSDTIIIPKNMTMVVSNNISLSRVVIRVLGTLKFTNGKISIDNQSKMIVETGGIIDGSGSNDQIRYDNAIVYKGSNGDITGPMQLGSQGFQPMSTLPVNFVAFTARKEGAFVVLNWVTDHEVNNSHFSIERSIDGVNWKSVGVMLPTAAAGTHRYEFKDALAQASVINYRIRQVDLDGASMFSKVQSIRPVESASYSKIFASSKNTITVQFASPAKSGSEVRVINLNGQVLQQVKVAALASNLQIAMNSGSGSYVVQLLDASGVSESKKLIL